MPRILLVLAAARAEDAAEALRSAAVHADEPELLSLGLAAPEGEVPVPEEGRAPVRLLREACSAWQAVQTLWQGETWVLVGCPELRFRKGWDRRLAREAGIRQGQSAMGAVLSGCLPSPADAIAAVRPVAAAGFTEDSLLVTEPGLPLRYAFESEPAALIHPDFCFARAAFFADAAQSAEDPCWVAFRRRWAVYTLHAPWVTRTDPAAMPVIAAPDEPELLRRFATHFGISFPARTLSAQAREGIWRASLDVPAKVPLRTRVHERLRGLDAITSRLNPLAVTAWLTLPGSDAEAELQLARFRRLCGLKNLPLVCWADRASLTAASRVLPAVREFSPRLGLPVRIRVSEENAAAWAMLSAPFLLAAARDADRSRTHYLWLDFDILRYPVYEKTALDWQTVCIDRIHIARVAGRADPTMFSVPEALVPMLCDDFSLLCEKSIRETGALPDPIGVWDTLLDAHPEHYEAIDLPAERELLSLTMPLRDEEWGEDPD